MEEVSFQLEQKQMAQMARDMEQVVEAVHFKKMVATAVQG